MYHGIAAARHPVGRHEASASAPIMIKRRTIKTAINTTMVTLANLLMHVSFLYGANKKLLVEKCQLKIELFFILVCARRQVDHVDHGRCVNRRAPNMARQKSPDFGIARSANKLWPTDTQGLSHKS
jgi:hypothetical protein